MLVLVEMRQGNAQKAPSLIIRCVMNAGGGRSGGVGMRLPWWRKEKLNSNNVDVTLEFIQQRVPTGLECFEVALT
jgi:hypothetical protein